MIVAQARAAHVWDVALAQSTFAALNDFRCFTRSTDRVGLAVTVPVGVQSMPRAVSSDKKPKVKDRKYLRPDEARRLIEAAGKRGRYPFRDKVLVRMVYRHGLRASEGVGMRWSQVDLGVWRRRSPDIAADRSGAWHYAVEIRDRDLR